MRLLAERLTYLRELEARRAAILKSIDEQGKLTGDLTATIRRATTKAELEDLYLPFKPKRRTKAEIARERGLGPLAEAILANRSAEPLRLAEAYVSQEVPGTKEALEGARDIVIEGLSENAALLGRLRAHMRDKAMLVAKVQKGKQEAGAKFSDYFDHSERWAKVAGHRALAMMRAAGPRISSASISKWTPTSPTRSSPPSGSSPARSTRRAMARAINGCGRLPAGPGARACASRSRST